MRSRLAAAVLVAVAALAGLAGPAPAQAGGVLGAAAGVVPRTIGKTDEAVVATRPGCSPSGPTAAPGPS